jgi:DNA polymerase-3 subunit beta
VLFKIDQDSLNISSKDLDFSNEAEETISCSYTGSPIQISFNAKFLMEMLNVLSADDIKMELSVPNRAGIIKPVDEDDSIDLLMLVMPVMTNTAS